MVNSDDCGDSIFLDFDRKMVKEKRYETTIHRKLIDCCKTLSNGGVVSTDEITPTYSHFLCLTVTERTNALAFFQDKYTQEQEDTHALILLVHLL